jgi:hypothetical protein
MPELSRRGLGAACGAAFLTAACGSRPTGAADPAKAAGTAGGGSGARSPGVQPVTTGVSIPAPPRLTAPLLSSDVLIYSQDTLDRSTIENIKKIKGVVAVETFSMGQFYVDEDEVTYAAVDPATFRRYAPPGTAQTEAVWARVADGEIAVEPAIGRKLQRQDGYMRLGNESSAKEIHIGAYAELLDPTKARRINAVVNYKWASKLGMRKDNAMLLGMDETSPQSIRKQLQQYAGTKASVQILGPDLDLGATQTAFLTGGSVAKAVGSFSYRANPDGTVTPDPAWVAAKITTEEMPIIGRVTGNRVMLPQLRAALTEVSLIRALQGKIYHYDGCYVPRFIAKDPSKGLSFHTFGTAIDLNAAANQRGTVGQMDRGVVAIFKKWGFAWGGDWHYTDPMHFELAKLVQAR